MAYVHYELRERPAGSSIAVEALMFSAIDDRPSYGPRPPIEARTADGIPYGMSPAAYLESPWTIYVDPPGVLARLFGDTLERRIMRARATIRARAEKRVARDTEMWQEWAALRAPTTSSADPSPRAPGDDS